MFADVFRRNASHRTISQSSEHICVNTLDNTDSVTCPTTETCLQMFSAGMLHTSLSVRALSTYVSTHWIIQTVLLVPRRKHVCRCFPQECFTPHYQNASHLTISQSSEHICVNTLDNIDSVACPTAETFVQMFAAGMLHTSLSVRALSTYVSTHWIIQTVLLVPRRKHVCRCFSQECFTPHYQSEL
ncbi:hypothetical protein J6590_069730 [Homalodisca vitripennis]|nr:hypothetical protein J6590_069730 [Homalodisca vitripennis]